MEGAVLYHSGAPERNPWCGGVTRVTSPAGRQHRENKEREEVVSLFFVCVRRRWRHRGDVRHRRRNRWSLRPSRHSRRPCARR